MPSWAGKFAPTSRLPPTSRRSPGVAHRPPLPPTEMTPSATPFRGDSRRPPVATDLRSDTVTRPGPEMRRAMAGADVGDDVYGDDPMVRALEAAVAGVLGKEGAVYVPTGTMANQTAIRAHTQPGDRVLLDAGAHAVRSEGGGPAALSGVTAHRLPGHRGIFTADDVAEALGFSYEGNPTTLTPPATLVCVENTHNGGGGSVWPLDQLDAVAGAARAAGLRSHMDGARLWNASAASGVSPARYAENFDSVSVCFSKALGAPVGSAVAGSAPFVARVRRFKQLFGGGFRQAGIIAAGALYALEHHRADLPHDHEKAARFAEVLAGAADLGVSAVAPQTNIVRFSVGCDAVGLARQCLADGIGVLPTGRRQLRAVFHRDVTLAQVQEAAGQIVTLVEHAARSSRRA